MKALPLLAALVLILAASLPAQSPGAADGPIRLGGPATIQDASLDAFGYPAPVLTRLQRRAFQVGNSFFRNNWVEAPASTKARDGLGPLFNARSCGGCHLRDGRGRPPEAGESAVTGFLLRLGRPAAGGHAPHPVYGGQLQDRGISKAAAEGRIEVEYEVLRGTYADGSAWELQRPRYEVASPAYGPLGDDIVLSPRVAPQIIGLGLLEAVPAGVLLRNEDPDDADGNGISGRARRVKGPDGERLGRFGWKAAMPTVKEQTAAAFVNDMGITSSLFADEIVTARQRETVRFVSGGSPEIEDRRLDRVAFYSLALAVPARRDVERAEVIAGERVFASLGCTDCHLPELTTGSESEIAGYRNQRFRPYTDLLLHDMGEELADGLSEDGGAAGPREWRTPPLWGIGLFEVVNGHTRYLHDGRARDLTEAVLWHGGEAAAARDRFLAREAKDRAALIAFLRSL